MTAFNMKKTAAFGAFEMVMVIAVIVFRILITGTFTFFSKIFFDYTIIYKSVKISVNGGFSDSISLNFKMFGDIVSNYMVVFVFFQII
jgi:hypothetical protein